MTPKSAALQIVGMSCDHCVRAVRDALSALPGITVREIDLPAGRASITWTEGSITIPAVAAALSAAGYRLGGFKPDAGSDTSTP